MNDIESLDTEDKRQPTELDKGELLIRLKTWFRESRDGTHDWRLNAKEDYAFVAGDQWDEKDVALLKEQLRPVVTFNRVGPVIDAVSGMEVNNRQEVRYIPRTAGDEGVNEVLTGAAQWVRDECDAEDEESDAFVDMLICGMGWTETRMDYETDPDGMVSISRVDALEMYWDPASRRRNLDDARYQFRVKEVAWSEARAMFPDYDDSELHASWAQPMFDAKAPDREEAKEYRGTEESDPKPKLCRIVETQWWEREKFVRVVLMTPGGPQEADLSLEEWAKVEDRAMKLSLPIEAVEQTRRVFKRAFIGAEILEVDDAPCPESFSYKCMTGKRDRNKGIWYGLVRGMKDPQRWANKFFANLMHNMASAGKGIIAERTAFEDHRQAEEDWARPDKIVWAQDGAVAGQKITPKPPSQLPAGLDKLLEFSLLSIRDGTGINTEMMGAADREQAGVLEYQRKQSAMTILAPMFDSLRRYRKEQGRVLLYFINEYISDGRLIRIVGDEGAQYVPVTKQDDTIKYDVIVDDAPSSPNQKEATWAVVSQLLPLLSKLPVSGDMWLATLEQSPLQASFVEKIREALEKQAQQPQPKDPAQIKAEAQVQVMQQKAQLDGQRSQMEIQLEQQRGQIEQVIAMQKLQMEREEHRMQMQQDQQRFMLELFQDRQKANQDMQIAAAKAETQNQISRDKARQPQAA